MPKSLSLLLTFIAVFVSCLSTAQSGRWSSTITADPLPFTIHHPDIPLLDAEGEPMTIVYLKNLGFDPISRTSAKENVSWLLDQGYRVVELDYQKNNRAVSPFIIQDIIAINDQLANRSFCGLEDCSLKRSLVLFEGYRIARNVAYFKDDPSVYNFPDQYTEGDSLYMDIIYPAAPKGPVPVILSFSYSNSYATYNTDQKKLTTANQHNRTFLPYTFALFDDSLLEGAPAAGMAWAIADHPKYCPWGSGKPSQGPNDAYKSFQTNPDAAQKVKSAIRTLRAKGSEFGLSGKIGIYGFSRGATAGSLAVGDKQVEAFENAGLFQSTPDDIQAAVLGPGVFDYTLIYDRSGDGDKNLEERCPLVWGAMDKNLKKWQSMGATYLIDTDASAPVFFFYNSDDDGYYEDQVLHFKEKLIQKNISNFLLRDYGSGHAVPKQGHELDQLYSFLRKQLVH